MSCRITLFQNKSEEREKALLEEIERQGALLEQIAAQLELPGKSLQHAGVKRKAGTCKKIIFADFLVLIRFLYLELRPLYIYAV